MRLGSNANVSTIQAISHNTSLKIDDKQQHYIHKEKGGGYISREVKLAIAICILVERNTLDLGVLFC